MRLDDESARICGVWVLFLWARFIDITIFDLIAASECFIVAASTAPSHAFYILYHIISLDKLE